MKELLTYALKFDSPILACLVQFVIILTELKKLLCQEVFVQQNYRSPTGASRMKTMDMSLLYFYCIRNK
jgi:hypothetical protein